MDVRDALDQLGGEGQPAFQPIKDSYSAANFQSDRSIGGMKFKTWIEKAIGLFICLDGFAEAIEFAPGGQREPCILPVRGPRGQRNERSVGRIGSLEVRYDRRLGAICNCRGRY